MRDSRKRTIELKLGSEEIVPCGLRFDFAKGVHVVMKRLAWRRHHADRNRAVVVPSFEIFEVAVMEGIFVVPFDFKRDPRAVGEGAQMIDLMRLPLFRGIM